MEKQANCTDSGGGGRAVGGAIRVNNPTSFRGQVAEDLVDVGTRGEAVTAVFTEAVEDLSRNSSSLTLSHLRLLLFDSASSSIAVVTSLLTCS